MAERTKAMTAEQQAEWDYRYQERLGILCADQEPTAEQKAIAKAEADEWVRQDSLKINLSGLKEVC